MSIEKFERFSQLPRELQREIFLEALLKKPIHQITLLTSIRPYNSCMLSAIIYYRYSVLSTFRRISDFESSILA
ncbi:hypothetical protein E3983_05965 [Legionella israelensis]|uniref:Uncharacterized protein n=1 Tax=Legionella israelensis TaxID=454 RepID=A0AAX1EFV2_9GAMM|nr:hypothetical protein [Legionella israelensis]QBR83932.1 hypothetical protein E3983_05965 [Legionella israelensis]